MNECIEVQHKGVTIRIASTGDTVNSYLYAGQQWDGDLGMYYLRARFYKPELGRFWTMDSFEGNNSDPLSLHKYLYCYSNPVNGNDPNGHEFDAISLTSSMAIRGYIQSGLTGGIINSVGNALIFHETSGSELAWNFTSGFLLGGFGNFTKLGGNLLISKFGLQGIGKLGLGLGRVGINAVAATAETVAKDKFLEGKEVSDQRIATLLAANFCLGWAIDYFESEGENISRGAQEELKRLKDYQGHGWPDGWAQLNPQERAFKEMVLKLAANPLDGNVWLGAVINVQKEVAEWMAEETVNQ